MDANNNPLMRASENALTPEKALTVMHSPLISLGKNMLSFLG